MVWQAFEASRRSDAEIARRKKEQDGEISFSYRDTDINFAKLLVSSLGDRIANVLVNISKIRKRRVIYHP